MEHAARTNNEEGIRVRRTDAQPVPEPLREKLLEYSAEAKKRALDILPEHDGGPEVDRIDAFFEAQGLRTNKAKVLTPDELMQYRDELALVGYHNSDLDQLGQHNGYGVANVAINIPDLDIIVAVRWPEYREGAGALKFQYILAHEKAHSTTDHQDITYTQTEADHVDYGTARMGQALHKGRKGIFLEEGFADYMAARYVRAELGLPNGIWQSSENLRLGRVEEVPPVYIWPSLLVPDDFSMTIGAMPAYGIELLVQKEPQLHAELIEARKSVDGLRRVAQIIDRVQPGLYTELRNLEENPDDFAKGLRTIKASLHQG